MKAMTHVQPAPSDLGARISFVNAGGYTRSLFIQKWASPQEINDLFN